MKKDNHFHSFWEKQNSPLHAHNTDYWNSRYGEEIKFILFNENLKCETIIDTGCGSGEFLNILSSESQKVYGIDFSSNMLAKAKERLLTENLHNVELYCENMLNIDTVFTNQKVDIIFNNGVIQYLTNDELEQFISKSKSLLKDSGKLVFMNIPNINCRDLFIIDFYRENKAISFFDIVKRLSVFKLSILKKRIKNRKFSFDDGIGNWFSFEFMYNLGEKYNLEGEILYSIFPPYGYRFHIVYKNKSN